LVRCAAPHVGATLAAPAPTPTPAPPLGGTGTLRTTRFASPPLVYVSICHESHGKCSLAADGGELTHLYDDVRALPGCLSATAGTDIPRMIGLPSRPGARALPRPSPRDYGLPPQQEAIGCQARHRVFMGRSERSR
jgi:hypothetical protein